MAKWIIKGWIIEWDKTWINDQEKLNKWINEWCRNKLIKKRLMNE